MLFALNELAIASQAFAFSVTVTSSLFLHSMMVRYGLQCFSSSSSSSADQFFPFFLVWKKIRWFYYFEKLIEYSIYCLPSWCSWCTWCSCYCFQLFRWWKNGCPISASCSSCVPFFRCLIFLEDTIDRTKLVRTEKLHIFNTFATHFLHIFNTIREKHVLHHSLLAK